MAVTGWLALLLATPILIATSLIGGVVPTVMKASHLRLQLALSFVSGLMLGVALLHLLPDAVEKLGSVERGTSLALLGVITVFLLMRFMHVHGGGPELDPHADCGHAHEPGNAGGPIRWLTLLAGLSLHSMVDGAALASAIRLESGAVWPGIVVLIVVAMHKPLDSMAIVTIVEDHAQRRRTVNLVYALVAPASAWAAYLGIASAGDAGQVVAGVAMAYCAGAFLCVALADLMPEVQFHTHHRMVLTLALALGVGVSVLLGLVEGLGESGSGHHHVPGQSTHRNP
ncbi:MAG TPA: hypothetical protein ENJ00_04575 [Phycisphaerales bacterium]|nr:hypothetical protein [Phycisphaerales bacterium]